MEKKKKLLNVFLVTALLGLIALSNCRNDNNIVNSHANTPPGAPNSEYPGNSSDSTSNASYRDSMHH